MEINQTALDYFQINYQDSLGKPLWDLRGNDTPEVNRAMVKEAIAQAAGGQLVRFEIQIAFARGISRTMDLSIKPVYNPGGRVPVLIIEGRDLTERKQTETGTGKIGEATASAFFPDIADPGKRTEKDCP